MTAAFAWLFNAEAPHENGGYQNSRADCPGECTLVTNPDGTKMWISMGAAGDVVAANAKGITYAEERTTQSATPVVKVAGTLIDMTITACPATAPYLGPFGIAADGFVAYSTDDWTSLVSTLGILETVY